RRLRRARRRPAAGRQPPRRPTAARRPHRPAGGLSPDEPDRGLRWPVPERESLDAARERYQGCAEGAVAAWWLPVAARRGNLDTQRLEPARRGAQRQSHHVQVAALQSLDGSKVLILDRVAARLVERLAPFDVTADPVLAVG